MKQKLSNRQLEEIVEKLLRVSYSIKEVYKKFVEIEILFYNEQFKEYLKEQFKEDLKEQFKEDLKYLDMCRELEDKLYDKILNENIDRIKYIMETLESQKNFCKSGLVEARILNYFQNYHYINPFYHIDSSEELKELRKSKVSSFTREKYQLLSQLFSTTDSEQKNEFGIASQSFLDFNQFLVHFLKQRIGNTNDKLLRTGLIQVKYEYIFACKAIEKRLLLEDLSEYLDFTNRERAILFNHDEEEVHQVYLQEGINVLENVFDLLFSVYMEPTSKLKQLVQREDCLITLRAVFSMLEVEEVKVIFWQLFYLYDWELVPTDVRSAVIDIYVEKMNKSYGYIKKQ